MKNSIVYKMQLIEESDKPTDPITFVFSANCESRSIKGIEYFRDNNIPIHSIIAIVYEGDIPQNTVSGLLRGYSVAEIKATTNPVDFAINLKGISENFWSDKIIFDISCVRIPDIFSTMKYIKMNIPFTSLQIIYSIPYDYNFPKEPFTSYKSFEDDLSMFELLGYGGISGDAEENNNLFLFMGFEGALALKVTEDTAYKELNLINSLPSFYQKYKDYSIINNYQLIQNKNRVLCTPADNPFETYNLLDNILGHDVPACIAPLSTKPIALGVCLFALDNEKIRVVYPISQRYTSENTVGTYKSIVYEIKI